MRFSGIVVAAIALAGCSRNIQTKEAVREAVVEYLNAKQAEMGLNMSAMNVEVANVSFQTDTALATVAFNLKTGEGGMRMNYELERKGSQWVVRSAKMAGGAPGLPPGGREPASPLPGGELPAGHPPLGSKP